MAGKVAQVACDRPRDDLRRTGQDGNGRHGFLYRFAHAAGADQGGPPVGAVFAVGRAAVSRGDCVLSGQGIRVVPDPPPPQDQPFLMPAPRSPRGMFELLCWHDENLGLGPLVRRLDLNGCKPQHLHYAVFGKSPAAMMPPAGGHYYVRDHLNELLLSEEFQSELIPTLLHAYEDRRRLIFLHIPKCAGTDLSNKLKTRHPWVDFNIMDPDWTTKEAMFRHLARLVVQLRFADALYLCGHALPQYYSEHGLLRPIDQVFTVVRHPFEMMISQVNYVLTRFWIDAERGEVGPDTQEWLGLIGYDALPETLSEEFVQEAGMRVLRNTDIVRPNSLCYWLAGRNAGCQAALDSLVAQDIEVTDTMNYAAWLTQRWNIQSQTRDNSSMKFFQPGQLPYDSQQYMQEISAEDRKLYQIVERSIGLTGRPWATGLELLYGVD